MNKKFFSLLIALCIAYPLCAFVGIGRGQFQRKGKPISVVGVNLDTTSCTKEMFAALRGWNFNAVRVQVAYAHQLPPLFKLAKKHKLYLQIVLAQNINLAELKPFFKRKELLSWEVANVLQAEQLNCLDTNHLIGLATQQGGMPQKYIKREEHSPVIDYVTLQLMPLDYGWVATTNLLYGLKNSFLQTSILLNELGREAHLLNKPLMVTSCAYPRNKMFRYEGSETYNREAYFATVMSFMNQQTDANAQIAACFFTQWQLNDANITNSDPQPHATYSIYPSDTNFLKVNAENNK